MPALRSRAVAAFSAAALFLAPAASTLFATDSILDAAFVTTISPGITPDSYPTFDTGTGAVNAVALQSDGKIVIGGNISRYKAPPAGSLQTSLKRLLADGTLDTAFGAYAATLADSQGQTEVNKILRVAGDKLYVGGVFTSYNGTTRGGILRLNADGSLDADPTTGFNADGIGNSSAFGIRYVLAIAEQSDGKVLVGGGFNRANGVYRPNLARFNADGSLDTTFNPNSALATSSFVGDLAILPDGDIIVGGGLNRSGGGSTPLLVRLNSDGSLDPSLAPAFADDYGDIDELLVLPDGRILVGGDVSLQPSGAHYYVACFRPDGSLDTAFMTNLGAGPNGWAGGELALQPDGTIFVGGIFDSWAGSPRASVARLQPDGTLDLGFAPPPYAVHPNNLTHFYSFAFQPDGKLVAGGWFNHVSDNAVETYNLTRFVNEYSPASPGTLRLVATSVSTAENAGSVTLEVSRYGGLSGAVSVDFATLTGASDGTATAGADFTASSGTLAWAAGEGGVKTITVPILADAALDGAKTFTVRLANNTAGTFLPVPASRATVTIRDVQAAPAITTQPASVSLEQGARFSLSVRYDSVLAATVQWQRDPDGPGGLDYADISGATSLSYTVTNADAATQAGLYRARVTNSNGSTLSAAATVTISIPAGSVVTGFAPADPGSIGFARLDSAGRHVVTTTTGLRRIGSDGVLEPTTSFGVTVSGVQALLAADDGRTYIAGNLSIPYTHQPSGATSSVSTRIFRLNADATGTIDSTWSVFVPGPVTALAQISGNRIIAGCSGAPTNDSGLRVFSTAGTTLGGFPTGFATGTGAMVRVVREQSDGKIVIAYSTGNTATHHIARFTSAFALDTTFGTGGVVTLPTYVKDFTLLPDGRIAFATNFSNLLNGNTQYFAILNADGSFDPSFISPSGVFNGAPSAITHRDGRLLVSGAWTTINGSTIGGLARINLDGSIDNTFSIGVGSVGAINAAYYTSTGEIFIGGSFTSFKGVSRNRAALLVGNPHIGAIGFAPPRLSVVEGNQTLALTLRRYGPFTEAASIAWATADGTALAGADYTASSGTVSWAAGDSADKTVSIPLIDDAVIESAKTFTVALSGATGPVGPAAPATITVIDSDTPVTITAQPAGSALLTGGSLSLSATATSPSPITYQWFRNGSAISGATSASYAKSGLTASDAGVYTLVATNASGSYTTTPVFVAVRPQPGSVYPGISVDRASFTNAAIQSIIPLPDGRAYIGGWFASVSANTSYRYFVRVNADLSLDGTYNPAPNNNVRIALRQPDGKILVGGDFTTWAGQSISRLVRLNADGSLDTAFNTAMGTGPNAAVYALTLLPDGRIVVGGAFTVFQGDNYLTVLLSTGAPDTSFSSTASNGPITELALRDVGGQTRLLAAGTFTNFSGANRLALLNTDGTRDTTFTQTLGSTVTMNDLLVHSDGRILVANTSSVAIAQLGLDGNLASNLASTNQAYDLAEAPGGSIVAIRTGTTGSDRVLRYKGTNPFPVPGSNDVDSVFSAGTGPASDPSAVAVGSDGAIWIGGTFSSYNSVSVGGLVKLYGDPANPAVVNPPANTGVIAGRTATFGVGAFGTGLAYQWLKDGTPLTDGGDISGATTALLSIANAELDDQAAYTVQITGGSPSTTITSPAARLYVLGAPVVATPPAAIDIIAGAALTISAETFAAAPATYQWSKDGVALANDARITGVTASTIAFASTLAADTGTYTLTITNPQGTATTSVFALVRPVPTARVAAFSGLSSSQSVTAFHALPDGGMLVANLGGTLTNNSVTTLTNRLQLVRADGTVANLGIDPANSATALPALGSGTISAVLRQADGKILVAGNSAGSGAYIARFLADGTADTGFANLYGSASTGSAIRTLALDDTGRILAGGDFTNFAGVTGQNYLVRFNGTTGALDTTFAPGIGGTVNKILRVPSGGFIVGGGFFTPQSYLARYDSTGARVTSFAPVAANTPDDLALTPDGTAFYVAANTAPRLYRFLVSTGAADTAFSVPTSAFNNQIWSIAVQPDGKVLAHGAFNTYPMIQVGRVLPTGAIDPTFITGGTNLNSGYYPLALDASGRVWVGGAFTTFNNVTPVNRIAVLEGDLPSLAWLTQPAPFSTASGSTIAFSASVRSTTPVTYQWYKNGTLLTNGGRVSGATSASLSITGATVADEGNYTVRATSLAAGTIESLPAEFVFLAAPEIVASPGGGTYETGVSKTLAVAARGAGTLSYQWFRGTASVPFAAISGATSATYTLATPTLADTAYYRVRVTNSLGEIYSAPVLVTYETRGGSIAASPAAGSVVNALLPLPDGSMVLGGAFTTLTPPGSTTATTVQRLARILPNNTIEPNTTFPIANGNVFRLHRDSSGRIIVASDSNGFLNLTRNGVTTSINRVARLLTDGSVDTSFTSPFATSGNLFYAASSEPDGRHYLAGQFSSALTTAGGSQYIARFSNGAPESATTFNPPAGFGTIRALHRRDDGKLLVGHNGGVWLLNSDGTRVTSGFANITVGALAFLPVANGEVIVATATTLYKIDSAGNTVAGWPASPINIGNSSNLILLGLPNGDFVLSGTVSSLNSQTAGHIAFFNANGTVDSSYAIGSGFNNVVLALALDSQNRLWAGGQFTTYKGATANRLVILNSATTTPADPGSPIVATPFETYLTGAGTPSGQSGPTDDPDGDGISNLMEYALGLAPMTSDPDGLPHVEKIGGFLSITYYALRSELLYEVETTSSLGSLGTWTTSGIDQGAPAGDGLVTATVPYSSGSRFLRLRVTVRP